MRALVIYCHPVGDSFNAAIRDLVLDKLRNAGAEYRLIDLYADGFQPVLSADELAGYVDSPANRTPVAAHCAAVAWCDALIFVYPTWWYGLPAMLKGWLDRVLLPDLAFLMPDAENADIRPGLQQITRLGVFTTCGASWWLMQWVGAPGKRTLFRGLGVLLHPGAKKVFAAHYLMDRSTDASRAKHLARVADRMDQFLGGTQPALSHPKTKATP
ncbi:NAD(P)H-dependent oxidoreductase [Tateyamaria pelophila]|uniref:NAD(P)H-dependent oxidoreductase n=1 Tax=Tateyamaria pelophila TaxID=328415 RepID=UPI001CBC0224|nr:NAD(P)H-dependent oxidoreductase [Tateyamaria pelophila]